MRTVIDSYEYDAYGNSFTVSGTTPNEMLYRGEQFDPDLGLYYLRARYYNPATGRFMSRDPENGQLKDPPTLHKYLYVGGNPTNAIDPLGRVIIVETTIIPRSWMKAGAYVALGLVGAAVACVMYETAEALTLPGKEPVLKAPRGGACTGVQPRRGPPTPNPPAPEPNPISGGTE